MNKHVKTFGILGAVVALSLGFAAAASSAAEATRAVITAGRAATSSYIVQAEASRQRSPR